MALQKNVEIGKTGFSADYHKLKIVEVGESIRATLQIFKDLETRNDPDLGSGISMKSFENIDFADVVVDLSLFDETSTLEDIIKTSIYNFIKTLPEYAGAADV